MLTSFYWNSKEKRGNQFMTFIFFLFTGPEGKKRKHSDCFSSMSALWYYHEFGVYVSVDHNRWMESEVQVQSNDVLSETQQVNNCASPLTPLRSSLQPGL